MILFRLKCSKEHEFEGWFRDNAAYDRQHAKGVIECPVCGDTAVEKAPMAPHLGRSRGERPEAPPPAVPTTARPGASDRPPGPADMRRMLREMRQQVELHCDYVGPQFADEARRIHRGEGRARGIYGEATPTESRKLAEEGIEVASIPWIPLSDA
jgi:hypothetical protein